MPFANSLRAKIGLFLVAEILAIVVLLLVYFPARMESRSRARIERHAATLAAVVAKASVQGLDYEDRTLTTGILHSFSAAEEVTYAVVRQRDGTIFASWPEDLDLADVPDVGVRPGREPALADHGGRLHVVLQIRTPRTDADVADEVPLPPAPIPAPPLPAGDLADEPPGIDDLPPPGTLGVDDPEPPVDVAVPPSPDPEPSSTQRDAAVLGSLQMGLSLHALDEEREANRAAVLIIAVILLLAGLGFAWGVGTYLVRPIQRVTAVAQRVATGDLREPGEITRSKDEVGQMAAAFDEMIRAQKRMVQEITETATELASAATQIRAAAQEQEAGTGEQQVAVEEVNRTMHSLLEAAGHIADSARGVLENATHTRETTDDTSGRIDELSGHTHRIAEILEVIRDIADRSDLLALNASLEATRAGEAGRSFSLVAAEMRRLAERVTASVQDVKNLVEDIRSSSTATVDSTGRSRELAESTTESAREITTVTQQQRTATEQASQSMAQVSDALSQSAAATQETRRSAEDLKALADRLSELVGRFVVR